MKRPNTDKQSAPHDYDRALQSAVSWLGERYLLAAPQPRQSPERPKYWTAQQHVTAHRIRATRH
jgi:hypothetical protein